MQIRQRIAVGLVGVGGGIALAYAVRQTAPKLIRRAMCGMMRSMMQEMMRQGEFSAET